MLPPATGTWGCCSPQQHRAMTLPRCGGRPRCWAWSPTPPILPWLRTSCRLTREWRSGTRSSVPRSTREHGRATGAGCTKPWRAYAGKDGNPDEAAWHRAAASMVPDEDVAADLERSAARAERRGGYVAQATFLARAADLTPDPRDRAVVRLLAAAQAHLVAGDGALAEAMLDLAAPRLAEAGLHVAAQRLRASIAIFFSRHKDAPGLLLDTVAAVDPPDAPLIRAMLFEALQAALVARQHTVGTTPLGEVARAALRSPRDPGLDPSGYRPAARRLRHPYRRRIPGGGAAAPRRGRGGSAPATSPRPPGYQAPSSDSSQRMTCGTTRDAGRYSCALRQSTAGTGHWARCG